MVLSTTVVDYCGTRPWRGLKLHGLRVLLRDRMQWYEKALDDAAHRNGYGHLSRSLVELFSYIGRDPVRLTDLAEKTQTSRQWISRLTNEGKDLGLLEVSVDPRDRRGAIVAFSDAGWDMVRLAVASMEAIEERIAERIGKPRFEELVAILSADWGNPSQGARENSDGARAVEIAER